MSTSARLGLIIAGVLGAIVLAVAAGIASYTSLVDNADSTAVAQEDTAERGIRVSGEGRVSVVPDTAEITVGVDIESDDLETARTDANERMDQITAALKDAGIDESDMQTSGYNVSAVRDWEDPEQGIIGYQVSHRLQVTVQPIDQTGTIIDVALDNGANIVHNVAFVVEDQEEAIRQAREAAIAEARKTAEHLAELTDVQLGVPIQISENAHTAPPVPMREEAMADEDMAGSAPATKIQPGESEIRVEVTISYGIN